MGSVKQDLLLHVEDLHKRFDAAGTSKNNLRASMYFYNTEEEVETLAKVVERVVKNPLDFMELQDVQELANFFERRVSAYQVGVAGEVELGAAF